MVFRFGITYAHDLIHSDLITLRPIELSSVAPLIENVSCRGVLNAKCGTGREYTCAALHKLD